MQILIAIDRYFRSARSRETCAVNCASVNCAPALHMLGEMYGMFESLEKIILMTDKACRVSNRNNIKRSELANIITMYRTFTMNSFAVCISPSSLWLPHFEVPSSCSLVDSERLGSDRQYLSRRTVRAEAAGILPLRLWLPS
jgi:hypothetical protein